MPERIVTVHRFEQLWRADGGPARAAAAAFEIECCSGTYVRSLIADLGDAYCVELRRTAIGPFEVTDAVAPPPRGRALERSAADRARARPSSCGAPLGLRAVRITRLPDVERGRAAASRSGTFDGVHLGHREVIAGADSVLTFDPHPVSVVAPAAHAEAADDAPSARPS